MQIVFNIIGGIIVAVLTAIYLELRRRHYKYNFKGVFGQDSDKEFFMIHGSLRHKDCFDKDGKPMEWPYEKPGAEGSFKSTSVISLSGARAAKYLSGVFGKILRSSPEFISDNEKREKLEISFCSFGGHNNFKTIDILKSDENKFFDLHADKIVSKQDNKEFRMYDNYDCGIILKLIPKNFSKKVWIAAAGLGEWGTSGAAWYLSRNWKKLPKNRPFGLITRTKIGQDESTE